MQLNTRLKKINEGKETDCRKDYIKFKFESDDDFPLNEPVIFYEMHIFVRFAFKGDDRLYPEFSLDKTLCKKMKFGANKAPIELIREGAFGDTFFREIYSGINEKWYKNLWKEFVQLKNIDVKFYASDYYDVNVNNMV